MWCAGCGREVSDSYYCCPFCGNHIQGKPLRGKRPAFELPTKRKVRKRYTMMLATAFIALVLAWGVVGLLLLAYITSTSELEGDLLFPYAMADSEEAAATYHEVVGVQGYVYNHGQTGCNASLHLRFYDDRGWYIEPVVDLGWIEPDGGWVYVEEYYDWPDYFNGEYLDEDSLIVSYHLESVT